MGSITSTPTPDTTGSSYPSRSVKGGTNSSEISDITPTPTTEKQAAFTPAVVSKAAPPAVQWAA